MEPSTRKTRNVVKAKVLQISNEKKGVKLNIKGATMGLFSIKESSNIIQ